MIKVSPKVKAAIDSRLHILSILSKENYDECVKTLDSFKSEKDIINYLIEPMPFYCEPTKEPNRQLLNKVINEEGIIISEQFHYPHIMKDENGNGILSTKRFCAFPLYIRRNQQVAMKEGKSAKSSHERDVSGAVSGDSQAGVFTMEELAMIISQGSFNVVKEFLGPGSTNMKAKEEIKSQIYSKGEASMDELPEHMAISGSVRQMDHILKALGYDSDIVGTPL
jgi:hypothetical protein